MSDFEKSLVVAQGVGSIESFFYSICYPIRYEKTEKVDKCDNFQDEIGKLLGLNEILQLILDHRRFEEQCFDINKALIEHGYFLRVEGKKKFIALIKKDSKKQETKKNGSSCIVKKFRGFDIVSIEYGRRQRTKFSLFDVIYKPMKKWTDIIDCYFSIDLASAYRPEWSTGKSLRHARAYQCYYCSSYYIQKARYQKHVE